MQEQQPRQLSQRQPSLQLQQQPPLQGGVDEQASVASSQQSAASSPVASPVKKTPRHEYSSSAGARRQTPGQAVRRLSESATSPLEELSGRAPPASAGLAAIAMAVQQGFTEVAVSMVDSTLGLTARVRGVQLSDDMPAG